MDSLITAAAQALAAGDPLNALTRVALREDAPALALRGIAMAQLGDLDRARTLLRRAARAFGPTELVSRARCVVAEAEIALVSRELSWPAPRLAAARQVLEAHGDRLNAAHARHLQVRRLLLIGRLDEAERALAELDPSPFPPAWTAAHELARAGLSLRRLRTAEARSALRRAERAALSAGIPGLLAEVRSAQDVLDAPAARLIANGAATPLRLDEVERLLESGDVIVDACRSAVRHRGLVISLATRPVLFELARALADAWPADASRPALVVRAFGGREADESHRARLRVEMGRLRRLLRPLATIVATARGFALVVPGRRRVVVLARPMDDPHAPLLALLGDGEAWSSSALALALGRSQRSVQRRLEALQADGRIVALGRGRARRWTTPPLPGITTTLLLPAALPVE